MVAKVQVEAFQPAKHEPHPKCPSQLEKLPEIDDHKSNSPGRDAEPVTDPQEQPPKEPSPEEVPLEEMLPDDLAVPDDFEVPPRVQLGGNSPDDPVKRVELPALLPRDNSPHVVPRIELPMIVADMSA